jgi:hypothetical protein
MTSHVWNIGNTGNAYKISGEIVGGLIGAIDKGIVVDKANLVMTSGNSATLAGKYYIGGLAGVNMGILHDSNVNLNTTLNIQSVSGGYIFRDEKTIVSGYELYSEHHGMTAGGAVGFNSGAVTDVKVTASLNNQNVFRLGGIVGENKGTGETGRGNVSDCTFMGAINGGFYIGGLIGVNSGTGTVIKGNVVNVTAWGGNFNAGTYIDAGSMFGEPEYDRIPSSLPDQWQFITIFPFLDRFGVTSVDRKLVTGGFIGENQDARMNGASNSTELLAKFGLCSANYVNGEYVPSIVGGNSCVGNLPGYSSTSPTSPGRITGLFTGSYPIILP